jgi:transmembrane sensor
MGEKNDLILNTMLKHARQEALNTNENILLKKWQRRSGEGRPLDDLIHDEQWLRKSLRGLYRRSSLEDWRALQHRIAESGDPMPVMVIDSRRLIGVLSMAVLVLLLVVAGISRHSGARVRMAAFTLPELPSAGEIAHFIRNDGSQVAFDSLPANSVLAKEGKVTVRKVDSYTLRYEGEPEGQVSISHCLCTGKTGAYRILFPGNLTAYLNSGTSFRYSYPFRGSKQPPELNGEACFDISPNSSIPFTVMANRTAVQVLGTKFDVCSYARDTMTTVSVGSGAVKVGHGSDTLQLAAGQTLRIKKNGLERITGTDFKELVVWTDSVFHFDNTSFDQAIKEIAECFHVIVYNPSNIRGIAVSGDLPRTLPLEKILNRIEEIENGHAFLKKSDHSIVITADPHR